MYQRSTDYIVINLDTTGYRHTSKSRHGSSEDGRFEITLSYQYL